MKKLGYTLRKLKAGLVPVVFLGVLLSSGQVLADEISNPAASQPVVTAEEQAVAVSELPVLEGVMTELVEKATVETVPVDTAVAGDVLEVTPTIGDPVVTEQVVDGRTVETMIQESTITTTSLATTEEPLGLQDPVVETKENTKIVYHEGQLLTVTEHLTKTTTVSVKQLSEETSQQFNADVVFVIDHTGSMGNEIAAVKENLTKFVSGLAEQGVGARLGLVDYDSGINSPGHFGARYVTFNGSLFTTDTSAFIAELDNIKIGGGIEAVTFPLTNLADYYTWSQDSNTKRFAIVLTDEDYDFDNGAPSVEETIAKLKLANISTSVITSKELQEEYRSLYTETGGTWTDIESDFSDTLTKDLSSWIIQTVGQNKRIKVVTEVYHYVADVVYPKVEVPAPVKSTPVHPSLPAPIKSLSVSASLPATVKPTPTSVSLPATGSSSETVSLLLGLSLLSFAGVAQLAKKLQD